MMSKNIKTLLSAVVLISALPFGESLRRELKKVVAKRVVGGSKAKDGQFPYAIALYSGGNFICTGSIISETSILTSANCVVNKGEPKPAENFNAIAGVANRSSGQGVFIKFKDVKVHPQFDEYTNDLAILETTAPIKFTDRVKPICIANDTIGSLVMSRVVTVGWGRINRERSIEILPANVHYAYLRVIGNPECQALLPRMELPSSVMCATSPLSGICYGDSGGPLVYNVTRAPVLVGLASYSDAAVYGCGTIGPGVFNRISSFTKYIKENATGDICVS